MIGTSVLVFCLVVLDRLGMHIKVFLFNFEAIVSIIIIILGYDYIIMIIVVIIIIIDDILNNRGITVK